MEPIISVEGTLNNGEGQAPILAEGASGPAQKQQGRDPEKPAQVQVHRTYAEFEINQDTREVIVRIIDAETGKLVRTIQPEELAKEIVKSNRYPN